MWVWQRKFKVFFSPNAFYQVSGRVLPSLTVISIMTLVIGLWSALFKSPIDYQQGDSVRIMYIHVPSAILSLMLYTTMAACSAAFLIWRTKLHDMAAKAIAPVGALFTLIALITGSLWGKPMWGTWWVWDARLTSELLLFFLYLAYILLDKSLPPGKQNALACAMLAVVGVIDVPIIHFSVQWWHTLHQGASLSLFEKPAIAPSMLFPLLCMFASLSLLAIVIILIRLRTIILIRGQSENTYAIQ